MMRIISGIRRGKKLDTLDGDNTRPTLERIKQAFFNAIQFEISDRKVLDLFSGSGQLGLEALSRGATFCYFNDLSVEACKIIDKNIKACGFTEISQLTCKMHTECVKMLARNNIKVSLVFLDPPYNKNLVNEALTVLRDFGVLEKDAVIVCETALGDTIDVSGYSVKREYKYSEIKITILNVTEVLK